MYNYIIFNINEIIIKIIFFLSSFSKYSIKDLYFVKYHSTLFNSFFQIFIIVPNEKECQFKIFINLNFDFKSLILIFENPNEHIISVNSSDFVIEQFVYFLCLNYLRINVKGNMLFPYNILLQIRVKKFYFSQTDFPLMPPISFY